MAGPLTWAGIPVFRFGGATFGTITDTADDEVVAAPPTGSQIWVTGVHVTNADASVGTIVLFSDGSTDYIRGEAHALGGFSFPFASPIPFGDNKPVNVNAVTTSAEIDGTLTYFIGPVA